MRYELSSKKHGIQPKVVQLLKNLDGISLYNNIYSLRHPLGIYNISFGSVLKKINAVLDELEIVSNKGNYRDPKKYDWDETLVSNLDHMLDSIMEHLDDCKNIICCFFEDCNSKPAKKSLRQFNQNIKKYRDHIAKIVNSIKHNQNRLRSMYFELQDEFIPGYYVEGVFSDGVIGPNPAIHDDGNVAISLNRDLPFHICNLYFVSSALSTTISDIVKPNSFKNGDNLQSSEGLNKALTRLSILPSTVFPDEVVKPLPLVRFINNKDKSEESLLLELPSRRLKPNSVPHGARIHMSFGGDGVTRTFKMPYSAK